MSPGSVAGSDSGSLASVARDCIRHGGVHGRSHGHQKDAPRGHRSSKDIRHLDSQALGVSMQNDARDRRWEYEAAAASRSRAPGGDAGDTPRHDLHSQPFQKAYASKRCVAGDVISMAAPGAAERQAITENRNNPRRHYDPRGHSLRGLAPVEHLVHPSFQQNDPGGQRQHVQRKVLLSSHAPQSISGPSEPVEALWQRRERHQAVDAKPKMTQPIHHGVVRNGYGNKRANSEPQVTDHRTVAKAQLPRHSSRERDVDHQDNPDPIELRGSSRHQLLLKSSHENVLAQPSGLWEKDSPRRGFGVGPTRFAPPPRTSQARRPPSSHLGSVLSAENLHAHERSLSGGSRSSRAGSASSRSSCTRSQSSRATSRPGVPRSSRRSHSMPHSPSSRLRNTDWTQLIGEAEDRGHASASKLNGSLSAGVLPNLDNSTSQVFLLGANGPLVNRGLFSPNHNTKKAIFPTNYSDDGRYDPVRRLLKSPSTRPTDILVAPFTSFLGQDR